MYLFMKDQRQARGRSETETVFYESVDGRGGVHRISGDRCGKNTYIHTYIYASLESQNPRRS